MCIVADGRRKVHPRVLDCLTLLGVYQPGGHMRNAINHKPVTAHLFEYTTSFAIDPNLHFKYPDKGIVPAQIIFCMKEKNQKKINSHRWFFNAFGPLLQVRKSCREVPPAQVLRNAYSRIYAYSSMWVPDRDKRVFTISGKRLISTQTWGEHAAK